MLKYTLSFGNAASQYVDICFTIEHNEEDMLLIQLPAWRPGRYELGNFAKNIQQWAAFDEKGNSLNHRKLKKDLWQVEAKGCAKVLIKYNYYAAELNAGSTFLDHHQLYVNPVNCLLYLPSRIDELCQMNLHLPGDYQVATALKLTEEQTVDGFKSISFHAESFHELADSPFIASASLIKQDYEVEGTRFIVWFQGLLNPNFEKIKQDFERFTKVQHQLFGAFPFKEYHFLFQILPHKAYHGVEHLNSTVITLGPAYAVMYGELYDELLGVSSHELFHAWNIKSIRPKEMLPYDYSGENYSRLGFVAEGVTTYYGDLMLYRSGVFNDKSYFTTFNEQLQKHFDNFGRFNLSVADSSFDTWLDGYSPGVPNRKVSIYTEGCLLAFISDVLIRKNTNNAKSLDDVMHILYVDFAQQNKPYSEKDYQRVLEQVSGLDMGDFFMQYVYGTDSLETLLHECLNYLGLTVTVKPTAKFNEAYLGFKIVEEQGKNVVKSIFPDSPAYQVGLMLNDQVVAVNEQKLTGDLQEWCAYFGKNSNQPLVLSVFSQGKLKEMSFSFSEKTFYKTYEVAKIQAPTEEQKKAYESWANRTL